MIHSHAHVDETVVYGRWLRIWQFASLVRGAVLGEKCSVGSCAIVDGATLGDECAVGHGASIHPGARLGNAVFVGPGAVICNDRWPRADKEGFDFEELLIERACVVIEDGASIGANAVVLPGVRIGQGAMVAAGAVVNRDVPADHLWTRDGEVAPIDWSRVERMGRVAC